jgi:iron(III) transport system substrate-binding protein
MTSRWRSRFLLALIVATTLVVLGLPARAQTNAGAKAAGPHRAIYLYRGADRDARLIDAAKKEGSVAVYTSLNTKDSVPLKDAFERKYGVKLVLWRSSSEKVLQRAVTETRAGRFAFDVIETNGPEMEAAYRENLLDEFWSPWLIDLPAEAFPSHRHYVADRFNFFTIAWNTNLVKAEDVPNSYEDLLNPKWRGKIGLEGGDVDWFAAMVGHMGEQKGLAYFRKLSAQRPQIRTGHTLIAELIASGEIPLAAAIYNHNAERLIVKGAPIKWKALAPTFGRQNAIGVAQNAAHPNAALLFADFVLSNEGQQLLKERNRVPANKSIDTPLNKFPFRMIDSEITLDHAEHWEKLWSELFLKGQAITKDQE